MLLLYTVLQVHAVEVVSAVGLVLHCVESCCVLLCCVMWCCVVLCCVVSCCVVLCHVVLCCVVLLSLSECHACIFMCKV